MSRVIFSWAFGAVFFQISAGAVYASFARQLGASEAVFGFLAGVTPLMGFLQIPSARLLENGFSPRTMMLWAGLTCRMLWVFAALLPIIHHLAPALAPREIMLPAFIGCLLLSSVGQAFAGPCFFTWMTALIPDRVGPLFWARRQQVGTIVAIFAVLGGGFIADNAGWINERSGGNWPPLLTYSALLSVAAVCGVMDIAFFFGVKEPHIERKSATLAPLWQSLSEPLREREVRNYLLFIMVAMIGFATTGPLTWLLCLETLGFDKTTTGLLITICPLAGMAVSARWWGAIAKRHGTRPMIRFASAGMLLVPIGWILALPDSKFSLALMLFTSGILVTAYDISNTNFITRACPHLPRPMLTALFAICAGTTFALFSWLSGVVAGAFDGWKWSFGGVQFINYHLVFAFSLVPRIINAVFLAPKLEDNSATGTREAVNEIGANFAAAFAPRFERFFGAREE
jgi:hypothetical protein